MLDFTEEYQKKVEKLWDTYVQNDTPIPDSLEGLNPEICDSWRRSKEYGIEPVYFKDSKLSIRKLNKALEKNQNLISVAHSYMEKLYSFIKGTNFKVVLSDENGCVIDIIGNDILINERTKISGLEIGADRNERHVGTNGIGTCLYLKKPIQIIGAEHYIKQHHMYVCSAAPIFDEDGKIIGCLDIVGPGEVQHIHTLGMVCAAVDGIEKSMKMKKAYDEISIINKQLKTTIQAINSGIIMIDACGIITQHNRDAIDILKLDHESLIHKNIRDIFQFDSGSMDLLETNESFYKKEISLITANNKAEHILMSYHVIKNDLHAKSSSVIVFEEIQGVHKMVSKMSGFTARYTFDSIIGDSKEISDVKALGLIASQSDSNVLILGESGTGKELVAQSIHNASSRRTGPFIAINCGSIPKGLIESELFGYEGGAFTGARKEGYPGKFELADGGTIFLDEIGDMPLDLQASLLRVIQTKEVVRVGGNRTKPVDVRIMAATNVNLVEQTRINNFRNDLYYRLNVLSIVIPPLRKRPDDIMPLAEKFIEVYSQSIGKKVKGLTSKAKKILENYDWPGNVRELENIIERAINVAQRDMISEKELPFDIVKGIKNLNIENQIMPEKTLLPVKTAEYQMILRALEECRGNMNKVTERLGIPRRTLYRRLNQYKIDVERYRV